MSQDLPIVKDDFNWTQRPVVGMALKIKGATIDSFSHPIKGDLYYEVGKHKISGIVCIIPTEKNQRHDFINDCLKRQNKFN